MNVNIVVEAGNTKNFLKERKRSTYHSSVNLRGKDDLCLVSQNSHIFKETDCHCKETSKFSPYFQKYFFSINFDINLPCPSAAIYFFLHLFPFKPLQHNGFYMEPS